MDSGDVDTVWIAGYPHSVGSPDVDTVWIAPLSTLCPHPRMWTQCGYTCGYIPLATLCPHPGSGMLYTVSTSPDPHVDSGDVDTVWVAGCGPTLCPHPRYRDVDSGDATTLCPHVDPQCG